MELETLDGDYTAQGNLDIKMKKNIKTAGITTRILGIIATITGVVSFFICMIFIRIERNIDKEESFAIIAGFFTGVFLLYFGISNFRLYKAVKKDIRADIYRSANTEKRIMHIAISGCLVFLMATGFVFWILTQL